MRGSRIVSPSAPKAHRPADFGEASLIGTTRMGGDVGQQRVWLTLRCTSTEWKKPMATPQAFTTQTPPCLGCPRTSRRSALLLWPTSGWPKDGSGGARMARPAWQHSIQNRCCRAAVQHVADRPVLFLQHCPLECDLKPRKAFARIPRRCVLTRLQKRGRCFHVVLPAPASCRCSRR